MVRPRISIITPNLNHGRFIERTICSVLDQGYEDLEYIVVDGGSTDDSVEIVRRYEDASVEPLVQLCRSRSDALNHGLSCATGKIIGILNSNDVYLPGTLDAVAERFSADDGPDWVVGQAQRINAFDQDTGTIAAQEPASLGSYLMRDSGFIPTGASFWRAGQIMGNATFSPALLFAGDYEYACRLLAAGIAPAVVPQTLVANREHPEGQSAATTLLRGLEHIAVAQGYAGELPLPQRYALWRNLDSRRRIYALAQTEMQSSAARRFLWQELLRHPWWFADEAIRHTLLHGVAHPLQTEAGPSRSAA